jgi:hypothetical protein
LKSRRRKTGQSEAHNSLPKKEEKNGEKKDTKERARNIYIIWRRERKRPF